MTGYKLYDSFYCWHPGHDQQLLGKNEINSERKLIWTLYRARKTNNLKDIKVALKYAHIWHWFSSPGRKCFSSFRPKQNVKLGTHWGLVTQYTYCNTKQVLCFKYCHNTCIVIHVIVSWIYMYWSNNTCIYTLKHTQVESKLKYCNIEHRIRN